MRPEKTGADPAGAGTTTVTDATLPAFTNDLARHLKRPVPDSTAIKGAFDIILHYESNPDDSSAASLIQAVQRETGLQLKPDKGTIQTLVVDHIENTPTAN